MEVRGEGAGVLVGQHERNGTVKSHFVVEFIFKHIKVVEPVWLTPARGRRGGSVM